MRALSSKKVVSILFCVLCLGILRIDFFALVLRQLSDPFLFSDDSRIYLPPFLSSPSSGILSDYVTTYLSNLLPLGFQLLYKILIPFISLAVLAKVITVFLWLVTLILIWCIARKLSRDHYVPFIAVCIALMSGYIMYRISGGIQRSFAYPLVAAAALAMISGRPGLLTLLTICGFALYPPIGLLIGIGLGLGIVTRMWGLSFRKGILLLAIAGGSAVALSLPTLVKLKPYGAQIRSSSVDEFPELGVGGRYEGEDRPPPPGKWNSTFFFELAKGIRASLTAYTGIYFIEKRLPNSKALFFYLFIVISLAGFVRKAWDDPRYQRFALLPLSGILGYYAALLLAPYFFLPQRYLSYSIPIFMTIAVPVGIERLLDDGGKRFPIATTTLFPVSLFFFFVFLFPGSKLTGIDTDERRFRSLYSYIQSLPAQAFIAGWPGRQIDSVPFLTARPALVTRETHQAFHTQYALQMRDRMSALIDAYFAADGEPLTHLRDRYGVTHLLVDQSDYEEPIPCLAQYSSGPFLGTRPPCYFEPFNAEIDRKRAVLNRCGVPFAEWVNDAAVFESGDLTLYDLNRVKVDFTQ